MAATLNIRTFLKKMLKEIRGITRRIQKAISKHITNPYNIDRARAHPLQVLLAR
jgi:hypothetical protein